MCVSYHIISRQSRNKYTFLLLLDIGNVQMIQCKLMNILNDFLTFSQRPVTLTDSCSPELCLLELNWSLTPVCSSETKELCCSSEILELSETTRGREISAGTWPAKYVSL